MRFNASSCKNTDQPFSASREYSLHSPGSTVNQMPCFFPKWIFVLLKKKNRVILLFGCFCHLVFHVSYLLSCPQLPFNLEASSANCLELSAGGDKGHSGRQPGRRAIASWQLGREDQSKKPVEGTTVTDGSQENVSTNLVTCNVPQPPAKYHHKHRYTIKTLLWRQRRLNALIQPIPSSWWLPVLPFLPKASCFCKLS